METVPQTVSIWHTFTHQKPRYQKLHGAIGGGGAPPPPLDTPLRILYHRQGSWCRNTVTVKRQIKHIGPTRVPGSGRERGGEGWLTPVENCPGAAIHLTHPTAIMILHLSHLCVSSHSPRSRIVPRPMVLRGMTRLHLIVTVTLPNVTWSICDW